MQPRMVLPFLAEKTHHWLLVNFMTSSTAFSSKLLSSQLTPSMDAWSFSTTGEIFFISVLFNLVRLLLASFAHLSCGTTTIWCISYSSQLCIMKNLLRLCSIPSPRSLNSTGLIIEPWGTSIVSSFHCS